MMRRGEAEASFEFDGKTWTIRLDFNAMADFEDNTGKDLLATMEAMSKGDAPPADMRAAVWAMLLDHHPDVTIRQAGRMVGVGMEALGRAAVSGLPTSSEAPSDEVSGGEGKLKAATAPAA
jgi:uncharacterized protein YbjT (DUF2867 family)